MPYKIVRNGTKYSVINLDTGHVYSKHTTKDKADRQLKLLHAIEPRDKKIGSGPVASTLRRIVGRRGPQIVPNADLVNEHGNVIFDDTQTATEIFTPDEYTRMRNYQNFIDNMRNIDNMR